MSAPRQGEIWQIDGERPALVLSVDKFNAGPAGLVIVAPLTSVDKGQPLHVRIEPPEGGTRETSFAKAEDVRSISSERLVERWGTVEGATLRAVTRRVALLIGA